MKNERGGNSGPLLDDCQLCHGKKGGVRGNENIVNGLIVCDYCTEEARNMETTPNPDKAALPENILASIRNKVLCSGGGDINNIGIAIVLSEYCRLRAPADGVNFQAFFNNVEKLEETYATTDDKLSREIVDYAVARSARQIAPAIRAAFTRLKALEAENAELKTRVERFGKWIRLHRQEMDKDHACAECAPYSEILIDGFRCAYHEARALLNAEQEVGK